MKYLAIIYIATAINGLQGTVVWMMPKPQFNARIGQVCGSNFETFSTYSRFLNAQTRMKNLLMLHPGPCSRMCQIYNPVCGSDGVNYHNACQLKYAKAKKPDLKLVRIGLCMVQPRRDYINLTKNRDIAIDYYDDTLRTAPDVPEPVEDGDPTVVLVT